MKKILHIEDDADTAEAIQTMLEMAGYSVESVRTGREGLEEAKKLYDLVLIDVMLPDISGWQIYKRLPKGCRIGFLSSLSISKSKLAELRSEGVSDYLTKPLTKEQLLKGVSQMLA